MGSTKMKEEAKEAKEEKQEKKEKPVKEKHVEKKKEMKAIVRVINTDIDADMPLIRALRDIKGISHSFANAVCITSGYNPKAKLGSLKEPDIAKVEDIIKNPGKFGIPSWLVNRRKDFESGNDVHLSGQDVDIGRRFDVQRLVDAKTYKGVRHMLGLPVRGQRTRSSFRKGRVVGVVRKSVRIVQQEAGKEEKK
jgi:small subunit ribosomal protein S13